MIKDLFKSEANKFSISMEKNPFILITIYIHRHSTIVLNKTTRLFISINTLF